MKRAVVSCVLLLSAACASHVPRARSVADDAPRRACVLQDSPRLQIPVPRGYALAVSPEACVLVNEDAHDAALLSFATLPTDGPEAEAILGSEDGARRWLRSSGLVGASSSEIEEPIEARLFGSVRRAYGLHAEPAGLGSSDVFVLSSRRADELLLVMLIAPRDDAPHRRELLDLLASVR